jgi:hypothetical protein
VKGAIGSGAAGAAGDSPVAIAPARAGSPARRGLRGALELGQQPLGAGSDDGLLVLGQVAPMKVERQHPAHRVGAGPLAHLGRDPGQLARAQPVAAVEDLALIEHDGLLLAVAADVVGHLGDGGVGHHRQHVAGGVNRVAGDGRGHGGASVAGARVGESGVRRGWARPGGA